MHKLVIRAGGGRIWYCPDDEAKTVWVTAVHIGHPKATE